MLNAMICHLCNKTIEKYDPVFNKLVLSEISVDICNDCIDKFLKWQQGKFAKMFPTKTIKNMSLI